MTRYEENTRDLDDARWEHLAGCVGCGVSLDTTVDRYFRVDGETVCRACVGVCSVCGEAIDDSWLDNLGPGVRTERRADAHALCEAEERLSLIAGYDMVDATREQIDAAMRNQAVAA